MNILRNHVGVLIRGTPDELKDLAQDLEWAAEHGKASGHLLTDDGVVATLIVCEDSQ